MAKTKPKAKSHNLILPFIVLGLLSAIFLGRVRKTDLASNNQNILLTPTPTISPRPTPTFRLTPIPTATPTLVVLQSTIQNVPFTAQAPRGQWSDPRFQDGCEEASSLMAVKWARNQTFSPGESESEIIQMASFQSVNYGSYIDTSAQDTVDRLLKGYLDYPNVQIKEVSSWEDIVKELVVGNLVMTPMNGRMLNNVNFIPPGPERHMVLVTGYDDKTKEFITHDPGTRNGANYRYPVRVFYNAIRDYESGNKVPIVGNSKVMIVINK